MQFSARITGTIGDEFGCTTGITERKRKQRCALRFYVQDEAVLTNLIQGIEECYLESVALAREHTSHRTSLVVVDNTLNCGLTSRQQLHIHGGNATYICTSGQHVQTYQNDNHIHGEACDSTDTPTGDPARSIVCLSHPDVCRTPKDESKERVEERAHERKEIRKEWNDFSDNESQDPKPSQDASPCCPT